MSVQEWATLSGILSIVGTALLGLYTVRKGKQSTDQTTQVVFIDKLLQRVSSLEKQMSDMWAMREADAMTKRAQGDHIDILEHHIWAQLPPPPPVRPPGI